MGFEKTVKFGNKTEFGIVQSGLLQVADRAVPLAFLRCKALNVCGELPGEVLSKLPVLIAALQTASSISAETPL